MSETGGTSSAGGGAPKEQTWDRLSCDPRIAMAALLDPPDDDRAVGLVGLKDTIPDTAGAQQAKRRGRPPKAAPEASTPKASSGRRRTPQRDSIMGVIERDCRLWHAPDSESFVSFTSGEYIEHAGVRSPEFRRWLCQQAYEATGEVPGSQAIEDALRIAEAMAQKGSEQSPWMRVGAREDRLFVDLCDRQRRYIDLSRHGWQIRQDGDAPFVRTPAMRPLCEPTEPGLSAGIDVLRAFVNVATQEDFVLTVAWLLAALRPSGPYPLLIVGGQQGAGKSTFSRLLRQLVDPNAAPIRSAPKDGRDLIVAAYNAHAQVFDNLSKVDGDLSDGLCRLATGGGFSTRALHTDRNEMIFHGQRPILLNGIPALAERADLADRSIGIRLVTIDENSRLTEADLWRDFEAAAPDILGALLDAMIVGIRNLPTTKLERPPRLADFATWITACEPGLGWEPGSFMRAFEANRHDVNESAFEADTVAVGIRNAIRDDHPRGWTGTPTQLLALLNSRVPEDIRKSRMWPFTAQALGSRLDRAAPLLRVQGLIVERKHSGSRFITIVHKETTRTEEATAYDA